MPLRNARFCFVLYHFHFPVTGSVIRDVMDCMQRRNNTVPCSTGVLRWVARNQEAKAGLGGKGDSSLIVHVFVIILYVLTGIICCYTLRCIDA
jgi:hypothetical protein